MPAAQLSAGAAAAAGGGAPAGAGAISNGQHTGAAEAAAAAVVPGAVVPAPGNPAGSAATGGACAECGAAIDVGELAPGVAVAELACGCHLCGGCAIPALVRAAPCHYRCSSHGADAKGVTTHRGVAVETGRVRDPASRRMVSVVAVETHSEATEFGSAHEPGELAVAWFFRGTSSSCNIGEPVTGSRWDLSGSAGVAIGDCLEGLFALLSVKVFAPEARHKAQPLGAEDGAGHDDGSGPGGVCSSVEGLVQCGKQDPALSVRLMHALCNGLVRPRGGAVEPHANGGDEKRRWLLPYVLASAIHKKINPYTPKPVQRTVAMLLDSAGHTPGAVWDFLSLLCVTMTKQKLSEQMLGDVGGTSALGSMAWDGINCLLYDNVNYERLKQKIKTGKSSSLNFIAKFYRVVSKDEVDLAFKKHAHDFATHTAERHLADIVKRDPEELKYEEGDHRLLHRSSLTRMGAIMGIFAAQEDQGNTPPVATALPGRAAAALDVDGTVEAEGGSNGADYVIDDPDREDLNSHQAVRGMLDEAQALAHKHVTPGSWMSHVKMMLLGDGKPTVHTMEDVAAHPETYTHVCAPGTGGFHTLKAGWEHCYRLALGTVVEEISGYRDSKGMQEYFAKSGDPRQVMEECPEHDAAFIWDATSALASDPAHDGRVVGPCDVARRMEERAVRCPLYMSRLQQLRVREVLYCLDNSSRNTKANPAGDLAACQAMERLLNLAFAATNATMYTKLMAYSRFNWLRMSDVQQEAYRLYGFVQQTRHGELRFADLWVELKIQAMRFHTGKSASPSTQKDLLLFCRYFFEIEESRHQGTGSAQPRQQRARGASAVTRAFKCAHTAIRGSNISGHGGLDTPIRVRNVTARAKDATVEVDCATLVALDGQPLLETGLAWMVVADTRLTGFHAHLCSKGVFGVGQPYPGFFKTIPLRAGDEGDLDCSQQLRDKSSNAHVLLFGKCNATGAQLFGGADFKARLLALRADPRTVLQAAGARKLEAGVSMAEAMVGTPGKPKGLPGVRASMGAALSVIRGAADIVAPKPPARANGATRVHAPSKSACNGDMADSDEYRRVSEHKLLRNPFAWMGADELQTETAALALPSFKVVGKRLEAVPESQQEASAPEYAGGAGAAGPARLAGAATGEQHGGLECLAMLSTI